MVAKVADRVQETTTTTGPGPFTLAGAAAGKRTFASAFSTGTTDIMVAIEDAAGPNWITGYATLSSAGELLVTSIAASSNGGSAVSFGPGTKNVFCTILAAEITTLLAGPIVGPSVINVSGTAGNGAVGLAYSASFAASGGTAPYAYSVVGGTLPAGLTLNASTGAISGSPTNAATYPFVIHAVDVNANGGNSTSQSVTIAASDTTAPTITSRAVANSTPGRIDLVFSEAMQTALGSTPAPGDFAVAGGSHVPTAFNWVDLTHAYLTVPSVGASETLTLAYASGTNKLKDAAGNLLASFSGANITNNVAGSSADTRPGYYLGVGTSPASGIVSSRTALTGSANGGKAGNAVVTTTASQYVFFAVLASAGTPVFHDDASNLNGGFSAYGGTYTDGNGAVWQPYRSDFPNAYPSSSYPSGASITLS